MSVASPKLVHGTQGKGHNVIQYLTQPLFGNTYLNPQYMNWMNQKCNSLKPQVVPFLSFIPSLHKSNKSFQTMFTRLWKKDIKSLNWDFFKVNSTMPSYFLDLRKFSISNRICFISFGLWGEGWGHYFT